MKKCLSCGAFSSELSNRCDHCGEAIGAATDVADNNNKSNIEHEQNSSASVDITVSALPSGKVFTDRKFMLGAFLGGPIMAGIMLRNNFLIFGEQARAQKTIFIAVAVTMFLGIAVLFIPESFAEIVGGTLDYIVTGLVALAAFYFFKKYQEENVKKYLGNSGAQFGWWRVVWQSILWSFATVAIWVMMYFIMDMLGIMDFLGISEFSEIE